MTEYHNIGRIVARDGCAKPFFEELLAGENERFEIFLENIDLNLIEYIIMPYEKTASQLITQAISELEAAVENPDNTNIESTFLYGLRCSILRNREDGYIFTIFAPKDSEAAQIKQNVLRIVKDLLPHYSNVSIHLDKPGEQEKA